MARKTRRVDGPRVADARQPSGEKYIPHPGDACDEAAARINVVIGVIRQTQDPKDPRDDDPANDDQGYGLYTAIELLTNIRDMLRTSSAAAVAEAKAARGQSGGGR